MGSRLRKNFSWKISSTRYWRESYEYNEPPCTYLPVLLVHLEMYVDVHALCLLLTFWLCMSDLSLDHNLEHPFRDLVWAVVFEDPC